jgi:hypothetical protein
MWQTSAGNRTLESAEAILVAASIDSLIEEICHDFNDDWHSAPEDTYQTGVYLFDELTVHQKISLLHNVAMHLLQPTPATLPLTAVTESAVAAIFAHLRSQTEAEIELYDEWTDQSSNFQASSDWQDDGVDNEYRFFWRELIKTAYHETSDFESTEDAIRECGDSEFDRHNGPELKSSDIEHWSECIESLADRILWDRDFEMAGAFLDDAPERSQKRKSIMGIEPDYFVDSVADPQVNEIPKLIAATQAIVRRKPR